MTQGSWSAAQQWHAIATAEVVQWLGLLRNYSASTQANNRCVGYAVQLSVACPEAQQCCWGQLT